MRNRTLRFILIGAWMASGLLPRAAPASDSEFVGAPAPSAALRSGPLNPEDELKTFSLPPGFEIELVAQESDEIGKFVTVEWDLHGRMWSMTALEYPLDANEQPEAAQALYASRARDKVVYWERPFGSGPLTPRVFADGLAMPLGLLPWKNGVYVQHGPDIVFLSDTNGDGRADKRETILSGFGVQDSHLFPHQFTRGPGNWIWMAQGAFNYGKVRTARGAEHQFDRTRMARFRLDGSDFKITSQGPCNIWGLVLTAEGEAFIQEANDYGFPVMPFHEYANYPGCSDVLFKSYAPEFPGTAPHFQMGGTGLSGLALSDDNGGWPKSYAGIFYIANPITRMIQAIKARRIGPRYELQKLPDFVLSSDEMFRPVAIRFGPDGCLYIVDWYNKIISHNEIPRGHPDRDKKRGRIWRVKHKSQKVFQVPDFTAIPEDQLVAALGHPVTAQHHLAWQAIIDRNANGLRPTLAAVARDATQPADRRIGALWALVGLRSFDVEMLRTLLQAGNRNVRREASRALAECAVQIARQDDTSNTPPPPGAGELLALLSPLVNDPDPEVRAQALRAAAPLVPLGPEAIAFCLGFARPSLDRPVMRSTANGRAIKAAEAYERDFERYLVRLFLEPHPRAVAEFLNSPRAEKLPLENLLLAALSLDPRASAAKVAQWLPRLTRPPNEEELLRLAEFPGEPGALEGLEQILHKPSLRMGAINVFLRHRNRLPKQQLAPVLSKVAAVLLETAPASPGHAEGVDLALQMISAFQLSALERSLITYLQAPAVKPPGKVAALKALREIRSQVISLFYDLAKQDADKAVRQEALLTLAISPAENAGELAMQLWPNLPFLQRNTVLDALSGTRQGARAIVNALQARTLARNDLNHSLLEKLRLVLPKDPVIAALSEEFQAVSRPALRLTGEEDAWLPANIDLPGEFTVEAWVKLDTGIDNKDGILGAPSVLDMNFHAGRFRVWVSGLNDIVAAKKPILPGHWMHLAASRDVAGRFHIYINGELDNTSSATTTQALTGLRLGWTTASGGTQGWLAEYRVWNHCRKAEQIRAHFDAAFDPQNPPLGLTHYFTHNNWPQPRSSARVMRTDDFPPLLNPAEADRLSQMFERYRRLAEQPGDPAKGGQLFAMLCKTCHTVQGEGGQIGPVLNGAGAMGMDGLLRAILTPNAAMEAGYRAYRVELKNGDLLDGFLVSQDQDSLVLRRPNSEDTRVPQEEIIRAGYLKTSLMPEGLLQGLPPAECADLLAYLKTLK